MKTTTTDLGTMYGKIEDAFAAGRLTREQFLDCERVLVDFENGESGVEVFAIVSSILRKCSK